jgi:hypothetical protein
MSEQGPEIVAAVGEMTTARHAHHEAGHAVAAVAVGSELIEVFLGTVDWSTSDNPQIHGRLLMTRQIHRVARVHRTDFALQPFVPFAGPWAEARWVLHNDSAVADMSEALGYAWDDNTDGDTEKYKKRAAALESAAAQLGFAPIGRALGNSSGAMSWPNCGQQRVSWQVCLSRVNERRMQKYVPRLQGWRSGRRCSHRHDLILRPNVRLRQYWDARWRCSARIRCCRKTGRN